MLRNAAAALIVLSGASAALAQHAGQHSQPAPYASLETRAVKALSDQPVADLDRLFAGKLVTPANLQEATEAIGSTQASLRVAHLRYHLATLDALTPHQVHRHRELRGYTGGHGGVGSRH
jgi:hypothetical protein